MMNFAESLIFFWQEQVVEISIPTHTAQKPMSWIRIKKSQGEQVLLFLSIFTEFFLTCCRQI